MEKMEKNTTKIIKGGATLPVFVKKVKISGQSGIQARNLYCLSIDIVFQAYKFYQEIINGSSIEPEGFIEDIHKKNHVLVMRKDHRLLGEWDRLFFRIKQVPGEIHFFLKKKEEVFKDFEKLPPSDSSFSDSLNYNFKGVKK